MYGQHQHQNYNNMNIKLSNNATFKKVTFVLFSKRTNCKPTNFGHRNIYIPIIITKDEYC